MIRFDARDCTVTDATPAALQACERALGALPAWRNDVDAPLAWALQDAPGFAMAHLLQAYRLGRAACPAVPRCWRCMPSASASVAIANSPSKPLPRHLSWITSAVVAAAIVSAVVLTAAPPSPDLVEALAVPTKNLRAATPASSLAALGQRAIGATLPPGPKQQGPSVPSGAH